MRFVLFAAALLFAGAFSAAAATKPASPEASQGGSLLPGGNSKDPVSIEADQLVYSDKEGKATYIGNVVLIQGATKLTCSTMVLFIDKGNASATSAPSASPSPAASAQPGASNSQVRHMDCAGPVTVLSKTQTATGDSAIYDKSQNKVWLIGNVTLSDGPNVTKGDKLTYDLASGQAHVETNAVKGKPGRVFSQFVPGSSDNPQPSASPAAAPEKSGKPASAKPSPAKP